MKEWLTIATQYSIVLIDAMALVLIVIGTIEAFFGGIRLMLSSPTSHEKRDVWLRYARWLVAGLTFQLAADVIETSIAPTWDDIGRVAAQPEFQERLLREGAEHEAMTLERFGQFMRAESARWAKIIKERNVRAQ